jgi:hypothetical protein
MNTYGGVEINLRLFLIAVLGGDGCMFSENCRCGQHCGMKFVEPMDCKIWRPCGYGLFILSEYRWGKCVVIFDKNCTV